MITHLFLDAFTHPTGWFVQHFAPLQQPLLALPTYKWLQYGGGVFGLGGCLLFALHAARHRPHRSAKTAWQKSRFWAACALLTLCGWAFWQTAAPIPLAHAATQTIHDSIALIRHAQAVLTPDTAIIHIAAALNKPIIGLYRQDAQNYANWYPKSENAQIIWVNQHIQEITPAQMIAALQNIIPTPTPPKAA